MRDFFWRLLLCVLSVCSPAIADDLGFFVKAEKNLAYDPNGNVTKCASAHAGEISYSYDPVNRLTGIDYPNGEATQYAYDCNNNLIEVHDPYGRTLYSYNPLNRLVRAEFPKGVSLDYEYDVASRLIKIIYPDKKEVNYLYDERGRLSLVRDHAGVTQYEYDDATNLVMREYLANGIVTDFTYDAFLMISSVNHKRADGSSIAFYHLVLRYRHFLQMDSPLK